MLALDSKTLSHDSRASLLDILCSDPENLAWSVRVIRYVAFAILKYVLQEEPHETLYLSHATSSPQAISSGMLRRPPINLNKQAEDATIMLIREVLDKGIELSEVRAPTSLLPKYIY